MIAPSDSTKERHDPLKEILVKRGDPNAPNILDQLDEYAFRPVSVESKSEPAKQANNHQNGSENCLQSSSAPKGTQATLSEPSRVVKVEAPAEPVPFQQWRDSISNS